MSFIDKAKAALTGKEDTLGKGGDTAAKGIDKLGDMVDKATGGKYSDKIDAASDKAERMVDKDGSAHTTADGPAATGPVTPPAGDQVARPATDPQPPPA